MTPIQELIEVLKIHRDTAHKKADKETHDAGRLHYYIVRGDALNDAISFAEAHLEKEKEVIIDAWIDDRFPLDKEWVKQCAEQYYNETFNTKEK